MPNAAVKDALTRALAEKRKDFAMVEGDYVRHAREAARLSGRVIELHDEIRDLEAHLRGLEAGARLAVIVGEPEPADQADGARA